MSKQAVILAAGKGRRLGEVSNGSPKCLVRVGGAALLEWQLQMLSRLGIERVAVVVGYEQEQVRHAVGDRGTCIHNAQYASTNSLYSLWLARHWVEGSFVLMNGDVFAHPRIYERLLDESGCALAYDASSGDDEEHMKVTMQDDRVRALGKDLPASRTDGENVGILHFDSPGAELLFEEADRLISSGGENNWAPAAVDRVVKRTQFRGVNIAGLPWTEIDFPEDVLAAERDVLPTIRRGRPASNEFDRQDRHAPANGSTSSPRRRENGALPRGRDPR